MEDIKERPVYCLLSTSTVSPAEAKKLWADSCGVCMKTSYRYRGVMYNVFFPNIKAFQKEGGGYSVTWERLRNDVEFEEFEPGILKGYYVGNR